MPDEPVRPHPHAILADDELIESVVQERLRRPAWPGGRDPDERLADLLSAWRADAGAGPVRPLVSIEAARAAVGRGRAQRRQRPLALVAALVVVVGVGLAIGAGTAQPGDPLWGLSRVVDGQRAESLTVALKVKSELSTARTALAQGRGDVATAALAQVQADLPAVRPDEGRDALAAEQRDLSTQVANALPAGAGIPPPPGTATPAPTQNPSDVRAQPQPPAGPPAASTSPNRAAPSANQGSPQPQLAQQPSNPTPADPNADTVPHADPPDAPLPATSPPADVSAGQGAGAAAHAPQQQAVEHAPPAHQPVLQVQLG